MPWITAGAVVGGALLSSQASKKAGSEQTAGTNAAINEQSRQYNQSRADLAPYRAAGNASLMRVGQLLGLNMPGMEYEQKLPDGRTVRQAAMEAADTEIARMNTERGVGRGDKMWNASFAEQGESDQGALIRQFASPILRQNNLSSAGGAQFSAEDVMAQDPGYQFRLGEGNKAIENAARARGTSMMPSTVKELLRYGQDYASGEFANVFNRNAGVAGLGQQAVNTGAGLGAQNAQTIGGLYAGLGNARGASAIAGGNAMAGGLNTIGGYYGQQNMLDKIIGAKGGGFQSNASLANQYNF